LITLARQIAFSPAAGDNKIELVFQDDEKESNPVSFKFLQMAHAHAKKLAEAKKAGDSGSNVLPGFATASKPSESTASRDDAASSDEE
jgi:crooked neck